MITRRDLKTEFRSWSGVSSKLEIEHHESPAYSVSDGVYGAGAERDRLVRISERAVLKKLYGDELPALLERAAHELCMHCDMPSFDLASSLHEAAAKMRGNKV